MSKKKRFQVALSFPGEYRDIVGDIANRLLHTFSKEEILYDEFHNEEFARPNLDTYLQSLYHNESELNVVLLCAEYDKKPWCGIESRAIRDRMNIGKQDDKLMFLKVGDGEVAGFYPTIDGYIDISKYSTEIIAESIVKRYKRINKLDTTHKHYGAKIPPQKTYINGGNNIYIAKNTKKFKQIVEKLHEDISLEFINENYKNFENDAEKFKAYSRLFETIIDTPSFKDEENMFEFFSKKIEKTNSLVPFELSGDPGTGKTSLLCILYWYQYYKVINNGEYSYVPIYLDFTYYDSKIYKSNTNLEDEYINALNITFNTIKYYIGMLNNKNVVFIVDGLDDYIKFKEALYVEFTRFIESIQDTKACNIKKIIGIGVKNNIKYEKNNICILLNAENNYELKKINTNEIDKAKIFVKEYINAICIEEKVISKISKFENNYLKKIEYVDFLTMYLIGHNLDSKINYGDTFSLNEIIKSYCINRLHRRNNNGFQSEELLLQTAKLAYEHFIEPKTFTFQDLNNNPNWRLIHTHSIINDYLIAYYIYKNIGSCNTSDDTLNKGDKQGLLECLYPTNINRFCKELINNDTKIHGSLLKEGDAISKINLKLTDAKEKIALLKNKICNLNDDYIEPLKLDGFGNVNELFEEYNTILKRYNPAYYSVIVYFIGRLKDKEKARKSLIDIKKSIYVSQEPSTDVKTVFFIRSLNVSLIYLDDFETLNEYIGYLNTNQKWNDLNRGFFLAYYGDIQYEISKNNLTYCDDVNIEFPKTLNKLYSDLYNSVDTKDRLTARFQFNLYTLCSLFQIRHIKLPIKDSEENFRNDVKSKLGYLLNKLKANKKLDDVCANLHSYLDFFQRNICSSEFISPISIYEKLNLVKSLQRNGWRRIGLNLNDTVAAHSFMCMIIAYMFCSKKDIDLNKVLKMLLIHDIAEVFIGDIPTPIKKNTDREDERFSVQNLALYSTFGIYGSTISDVQKLYHEFETGETNESKIANQIDKIENIFQLRENKYKLKTKEDFEDWQKSVKTYVNAVGGEPQEILQMLNEHYDYKDNKLPKDLIVLENNKGCIIDNENKKISISSNILKDINITDIKNVAIIMNDNKKDKEGDIDRYKLKNILKVDYLDSIENFYEFSIVDINEKEIELLYGIADILQNNLYNSFDMEGLFKRFKK